MEAVRVDVTGFQTQANLDVIKQRLIENGFIISHAEGDLIQTENREVDNNKEEEVLDFLEEMFEEPMILDDCKVDIKAYYIYAANISSEIEEFEEEIGSGWLAVS